MSIEQKQERQTDNMGPAGRVETGPPKIEQAHDREGNRSNSYTREAARETLAADKNLTPERKQSLENQTSCLQGEAFRKASTEGTKPPDNSRMKEKKDT